MNFKVLGKILAALVAGVAISILQLPEKKLIQNYAADSSAEDIKNTLKEKKAQLKIVGQLPSLGFGNMVANVTFVQFLQYFGDSEARDKTDYTASSDFFAATLEHDPYYLAYYLFLSGSNTLYAGDPEGTVRIMNNNLKKISPNQPFNGFYVWRYKAVDELLFLGDTTAAEASFTMAADWAEQSQHPDATIVSKQSRRTSEFLASNPDSRVAQIDAWSSLLTTALDKGTRLRAVERIEALGGSVMFGKDGGMSIRYEKIENNHSSDT